MSNEIQKNMKNKLQKGSATPLIVVGIALVLIIGGISYFATNNEPSAMKDSVMGSDENMIEKSDEMMEEKNSMMEKKDGEMMEGDSVMTKYSGTVLAGTSAPLLDFKKSDYDAATQSGKLVALFFYANWCPTCKVEFPIMQSAFDGLSTDKVVGFRVNYNDNETDSDEVGLAKEFGVAYQHTKVFVRNGERIFKSPESWDKSRYESEISKALAQ